MGHGWSSSASVQGSHVKAGAGAEWLKVSVGGAPYWTWNFPGVNFVGGGVSGVDGYCEVDETGKISEIVVTSPGGSWVTEDGAVSPPEVRIPGSFYHSKALGTQTHGTIRATAHVTTDPDIIKEKLGALGNGEADMDAAIAAVLAQKEQGEFSDPLAQSFTILSEGPTQDGVFITGVDLYFAGKPDTTQGDTDLGITVDLRTVINGQPSRYILPTGGGSYAAKNLLPNEITIADGDPLGTNIVPSLDMANTATSFIFDAPVYLVPGQQYAFVVTSNSNKYFIWRANENENLVGTGVTTAAIPIGGSSNPVLATTSDHVGGTMFKSEQGSANFMPWIADPESDLMFRIRRADFDIGASSAAVLKAGENLESGDNLIHDFRINIRDNSPRSCDVNYKYRATDVGGTLGIHKNVSEDGIHEQLAEALTLKSGGAYDDFGSFEVQATLKSDNRYVSPVIDTTQFNMTYKENKIGPGGLRAENVFVKNGGSGYNATDTFTTQGGGGSGAVLTVPANGRAADGEITALTLTTAGSGYHSSPTIIPSSVNGTGAEISYSGEDQKSGGNSDSRYITRIVNLKAGLDASDLRVFLTAHKPLGTEFHVYYKVISSEDNDLFENKKWVRMIPEDEAQFNARIPGQRVEDIAMSEYEFNTGENERITYEDSNGNLYDTFQAFAIKIVMFSDDAVKYPILEDLRAIALT
jgi:hypothetical protein